MTEATRATSSDDERYPAPEEVARLLAEREALRTECDALRHEAQRLRSINRMLDGRLRVAEAERTRLRKWTDAVHKSAAWRAIQSIRGLLGRRW